MKKVATFFAIAAVVALSSCGSKTAEEATEAMDSTATEMTETAAAAVDTMAAMVDSVAAMVTTDSVAQ
jgi:hypothetical protein